VSGAGAACAADRLSTPIRLASAPSPPAALWRASLLHRFPDEPTSSDQHITSRSRDGIVTWAYRPLLRKACSEQRRSAPAIARWDDSHWPSGHAGDDRPKCARTGPSKTRAPCSQF